MEQGKKIVQISIIGIITNLVLVAFKAAVWVLFFDSLICRP